MDVTAKLDRRFLNTRVDPKDPIAFARWQMDVNLFLDDISRVIESNYPLSSTSISLSNYLKIADAVATYLSITGAAATYETIVHAMATYLSKMDAAATYETIADSLASIAYGNMYVYNLGAGFTVVIGAPDVFTLISNATINAGTLQGFTFQNNQELKCTNPGTYFATWALSVEALGSNQEAEGAIGINNVAQTSTAAHAEIINAAKPATISGSGILTLAQNDLVRMYINNHTGANNLVIDHLTLTLTRMGD